MALSLTESTRRRESEDGQNYENVHAKGHKREDMQYVCRFILLLDNFFALLYSYYCLLVKSI